MASELILRLQNRSGNFSCEKYDNFPSPKSAHIAIGFTDNAQSEQLAITLKNTLVSALNRLSSNFIQTTPPCHASLMPVLKCQALNIQENYKLLIIVTDGNSNQFTDPSITHWDYTTLPVLQEDTPFSLPTPFDIPNAAFWQADIGEVIPTIFSLTGVSEEDQKIFISYRRTDTYEFAVQLSDKLSHEGFDVFLDRFSIPPSINFQNRLYQELADKAMILCLESPDYQNSQWVQYEIAFAKKYRLGVFAINVNHSPKVLSIDDEFRRDVWLSGSVLDEGILDSLVNEIKYQHSIALFRMRYYLTQNIFIALNNSGLSPNEDQRGVIHFMNSSHLEYSILARPRPPHLADYHYLDSVSIPGKKIMLGPEFVEEKRDLLNSWISQKSAIDFYPEGSILELCNYVIS